MAISFEEGEHIVLEVRKHWFVLVTKLFVVIVLGLLPLFVYSALVGLLGGFGVDGDARMIEATFTHLLQFFYFVWLLLLWIYIFIVWTDYFLDIWIITNKKILAVEQHGLFKREVSTILLAKVQDVSTEVHGFINTLLDFGDLQVETAGGMRTFIIHSVARPGATRQKINEVLNKYHDTTKEDNGV